MGAGGGKTRSKGFDDVCFWCCRLQMLLWWCLLGEPYCVGSFFFCEFLQEPFGGARNGFMVVGCNAVFVVLSRCLVLGANTGQRSV